MCNKNKINGTLYGGLSKALSAVYILLSFASCLDDAPCPMVNYSPRFVFTYEGGEKEETTAPMQKATVYVFDNDNRFVNSWLLDTPQLNHEYSIPMNLPEGEYHFIVWGNQYPPYFNTSVTKSTPESKIDLSHAALYLQIPQDHIVRYTLPPLFYGASGKKELKRTDLLVTIPLTQNTNQVILDVKGLTRTEDTYLFDIEDNNGVYDFDNNLCPCSDFHYVQTATFPADSSTLTTSIITLKLADDRNPLFTFSDQTTGKTLFPSYAGQENNLTKMIRRAYEGKSLDFRTRHIFRITLDFAADLTASISVDGWKMDESDYGIGD